VCDVTFSVVWDVVEHDRPHSVGACNLLLLRFCGVLATTLAESEDFRMCPKWLCIWDADGVGRVQVIAPFRDLVLGTK